MIAHPHLPYNHRNNCKTSSYC